MGTRRDPNSRPHPKVRTRAVKREEVVPNTTRRRGSDADNPGGELDHADDVHKRYKNSPVLSCIGR